MSYCYCEMEECEELAIWRYCKGHMEMHERAGCEDAFKEGEKAAEARIVAWLHGVMSGVDMCRCGNVNMSDVIEAIEKRTYREGK